MSKYVRKLIPYLSCDMQELQNWLEDMAKKGLFYKESGFFCAKFERGEPRECHYKLEYENIVTGHIPPDKQAMYEQFGWTVLDDIRPGMVVVRTDNENYENDDEITIEKVSALEDIQKKHRRLGILYLILWAFSYAPIPLIQLIFGSEKASIFDLLTIGTAESIIAVVVGMLLLLEGIYRLSHSRRMKKHIESLKGKEEQPEKKSNTFVCTVMSALSVPLVLLWILTSMFGTTLFLTKSGESVFEPGEYDFPLISEINAEEWQRVLDIHEKEPSEPLLTLYKDRDLLADNMYEVWVDDIYWANDEFDFDYHVCYYDMKHEKHAAMLMDELAADCSDVDDSVITKHIEKEYDKDGCQAKYYKDTYNDLDGIKRVNQVLLVLHDNELVEAVYYGDSDLSEYVDLYISYLKK